IPEEMVPVQRIGRMTLNRNPDNYFAETEQVAFHVAHVVPGIDFTNDPLMQGRLFSYTDTQLKRLGSPNFHEIPINRPLEGLLHNNQRDGHMRQMINKGRISYQPNSIGGGCPFQAGRMDSGFVSHAEKIDAHKIRARSQSFFDHFSQATLFYNSQSEPERKHLGDAISFELSMVQVPAVRERVLGLLTQVDRRLVEHVAEKLGLPVPSGPMRPMNHSVPADADQKKFEPISKPLSLKSSAALSMANQPADTIKSRKIAIMIANGVDDKALKTVKSALEAAGAVTQLIAPTLGAVKGNSGAMWKPDQSFLNAASVLFDALFIPGGAASANTLAREANAIHFVNETYRHCKAISADREGAEFLMRTQVGVALQAGKESDAKKLAKAGLIICGTAQDFVEAIAKHRFWNYEAQRLVPA
ncbi:MAG: catalase, partial [Candidatus Sumerlaeota bacterium]